MTTETLIRDRALPTAELLAQLLRVLESTPRRAPEEVVALVQRELERKASPFEADARDTAYNADKEEGIMSTIDAWTYSSSVVARNIVGYDVEALDGEIGTVSEASDEVGGSYIIVDTGPWIFGKKVMLPAIAIDRVDHSDERIWVNRSKDEIKNAPEFDESRYRDDHYRRDLAAYYTARTNR